MLSAAASGPSIFVQPADKTLPIDTQGYLYCAADTQASYQWYEGVSGDVSHPLFLETQPGSSEFLTGPISTTTSFWVRVSNASGYTDSRTATLTPVHLTGFLEEPAGGPAVPGRLVILVSYARGEGPVAYQWYLGASGDVSQPIAGAFLNTLAVVVTATTSYWVRATSLSGSVDSLTATLEVLSKAPPTFNSNGPWFVGQDITASVHADGATAYEVQGLPAGMTFSGASGTIGGTPRVPGTYVLRMRARTLYVTTDTLTVTMVVQSLSPGASGTFVGVVDRDVILNNALGGAFTLTLSPVGVYTGSYVLGAVRRRFVGRAVVYGDGGAEINITTPNVKLATGEVGDIYLHMYKGAEATDFTLFGTAHTNTLYGQSPDVEIKGVRIDWRAMGGASTPYVGGYSAALRPELDVNGYPAYPQGTGYVFESVGRNGAVTMVARLADNTVVSAASVVGMGGSIPVSWVTYGGNGSVQGWQSLGEDSTYGMLLDGDVSWMKLPQPGRSYKDGITLHTLTTVGSKVVVPARGQIELGLQDKPGNAGLSFEDQAFPLPFRITRANIPMGGPPELKRMVINTATSTFQGTMLLDGLRSPFFGVFVPRLAMGLGHVQHAQGSSATSPILSGRVLLLGL